MSQGQTSQRLRPFKPQSFGRYTLLTPLSTGGMGEIFLAQGQGSHGVDTLCVIKKILPHLAQNQEFVSRFVDEARTLVQLSHGNIAQVLDMGVNDGAPYISLEFIDGKDLRRVISRMRERNLTLPLSFVLSVMTRVLDALAYAHRKRGDDGTELNLVHRDVSPQNVLISYEGEVKIIDFGLAKSALSLSKTNPSIVLGKFMYMSPEQARHKAVDRRSDLYAAGVCLWELVTGKNPFDDVPQGELLARVGSPSIPSLNSVDPLCPMALSDAVAKALAPDPAQRFQNAEEFRDRLQVILQDIDPLAGAETASRFMRDAFAAEYNSERRMLATVKDQARALQPDDEDLSSEETADNMQSPFAPRLTPLATPVVVVLGDGAAPSPDQASITLDELTPTADRLTALQPEALSFAPTRKANGTPASRAKGTDHERETLPAILSRPDAPAAPAPSQIRARVVAKAFDHESTEAAAPPIAEPAVMPSIVIEGIPTELEMPAQTGSPPPPPPRASRGSMPKLEAKKPAKGRPTSDKPKAPKVEKTAERRAAQRPAPPQRTDTMIIRNPIIDLPPPGSQPALAKTKSGARWVWFLFPALAVAGVGGTIGWDLYRDAEQRKQAAQVFEEVADEAEQVDVVPGPKPAPPPEPQQPALEEPPAEPEKVEAPKRKTPPEVVETAAESGGSPGAVALRALQGDFEKLVDDGAQRKYRLQLSQLENDVSDKGDDPAFVKKIEGLHEQVKTALAKQQ